MSCNPPCCKADEDRRCPQCYTDQEWDTLLPPTEIIRVSPDDKWVLNGGEGQTFYPDLLKDSTGDATVGECGNAVSGRNGSDGFDSHTYVSAYKNHGDDEGERLGIPRTEVGDSLPRPVPTASNPYIDNQIVGGKMYGTVTVFGIPTSSLGSTFGGPLRGVPRGGAHMWGGFWIPSQSLLDNQYTKSAEFTVGYEKFGPDSLFDTIPSDPSDWSPTNTQYFSGQFGGGYLLAKILLPFINGSSNDDLNRRSHLNWVRFSFVASTGDNQQVTPQIVENGDDISNEDFVGRSLNDRRVFAVMRNYRYDPDSGGGFGGVDPSGGGTSNQGLLYWDTGLTVGDLLSSGLVVRVFTEQLTAPVSSSTMSFNSTISFPQSGVQIEEVVNARYRRCLTGFFSGAVSGISKDGPGQILPNYTGPLTTDQEPYDLCTHDPSWWVDPINAAITFNDQKYLGAFGYISKLKVGDGTFDDDAFLLVTEVALRDSSGAIKQRWTANDFNAITIPSGETLSVGVVETDDDVTVRIENAGNSTAEISSATFDDPWLTAVSDASPTVLPYQVQILTFDAEPAVDPDLSTTITLTHDSTGSKIISPWVVTLDAEEAPGGGGPPE